jgi:maltooligosyltrehalose trehalohydrolase
VSESPRFGPLLTAGGVGFRLWAPGARAVKLMLDKPLDMEKRGGWFALHVAEAGPGTRYTFNIDGEIDIPDPASHCQPRDVHGPSEVIDHASFQWQTKDWQGLPWERAAFLESHVGTFTKAGTFRAMSEHLDHLAQTGITALELMPVADFPGRWNWGYDGVLLFAPDSAYGRPDDLKALVDAAHSRGIMVFLDVVYNHFGPEGNYLHRIAPAFFSDEHHTPWGVAIDYRVPEVRAFAIENALHWLRDYRFDGLRLDAVHPIVEPGKPNILTELAAAVNELAATSGRHIHLVLENDDNAAHFLQLTPKPANGFYRAQWNDDYHHAWHVLLTAESAGYYRDYQDAGSHIARTLAQGFAYQGEHSAFRGRARGEPSAQLPRADFVNFVQNHDQIGNRPMGERLSVLAKPQALEAALAVLFLQPGPPLMFMGDEWGATEPFPFFCDFKGELAQAVRQGRRREFAEAYAVHGDEIPDPLSQATRDSAVLDWSARTEPAHAKRLALTRALLAARHCFVAPLIPAMTTPGDVQFETGLLAARWAAGNKALMLLANLADAAQAKPAGAWGQPIWGDAPPDVLPPWSVYAALQSSESFRGASAASEPGMTGNKSGDT